MVTKLSGFGQYLGRNLLKVENFNFGRGIVLFGTGNLFGTKNMNFPNFETILH